MGRFATAIIGKTYAAQVPVSADASAVLPVGNAKSVAVTIDVTAITLATAFNVRLQGRNRTSFVAGSETYTPWADIRFNKTTDNGTTGSGGADAIVKGSGTAVFTASGQADNPPYEMIRALLTSTGGTNFTGVVYLSRSAGD